MYYPSMRPNKLSWAKETSVTTTVNWVKIRMKLHYLIKRIPYQNYGFWDVAPWGSVDKYQHFVRIYRLDLQGRKVGLPIIKLETGGSPKSFYVISKLHDVTSQEAVSLY
jgi:hypothetical protein